MMKIKFILLAAVFTFSTALRADVVILTIDIDKAYENYHRAKEATTKFGSSVETAEEEISQLMEEGRQLAEELQEEMGKANNPALTEEARNRHGARSETLTTEIRRKQSELNNYRQQTQQQLELRRKEVSNCWATYFHI